MREKRGKRKEKRSDGVARAPRKRRGARLGQHFLTRPEVAGWVADALPLTTKDTVLEIGPGHGILTRELLKRAGKVLAVEKDPTLAAELRVTFATELANGTLSLLNEDIRGFDPSSHPGLKPENYVLVANIPYYLTGYLIRTFLSTAHQPSAMALLVQREVAERIVARDGKESLLSISVKAYGTPELVRVVKAGAFSPPPRVESAILAIHEISREKFADKRCEERVFTLAHLAFSTKRKKIGTSLKGALSANIFDRCVVPPSSRPEELTVKQWLCLAT